MRVFRIWRAISIACRYCTKFGIIAASNAFVLQMRKTHPFRFHGTDGFLLVEALPQAPANTVFQTAAARF